METLFLLIASHYLCDFALQNDFMAKMKFPMVNGEYNPMWWQILLAHTTIQGLGVYFATHRLDLALLEVAAHFVIDLSKCKGKISFNEDQLAHIVCKMIWWLLL